MPGPDSQSSNQEISARDPGGRTEKELKRQAPELLTKLSFATHVYGIQSLLAPITWYQGWKDYLYPPDGRPNILKKYEARPYLPVRIFFPASYDQMSPHTLPTLFTIHGGGFCFGNNRNDDVWNRTFADRHNTLVISLNYSKAPWAPFPAAIYDIEAVILSVLADESLPIDRSPRSQRHGLSRTAILGFSAGGNLALTVSQLQTIRTHALAPAAAVSVYGCMDMSVPPHEKLSNRPFKPSMGPPRGAATDDLMQFLPTFDWSYIPYGHDLRDPLLSPIFASREHLPPFVGLVGAELDLIAHESWRLACRLSKEGVESRGGPFVGKGRLVPDRESKNLAERVCGQQQVSTYQGRLLGLGHHGPGDTDSRFAFEDYWDYGGVKWLLVPDVLHAFDNPDLRQANSKGNKETIQDAEAKTVLCMDEIGNWLRKKAWEL